MKKQDNETDQLAVLLGLIDEYFKSKGYSHFVFPMKGFHEARNNAQGGHHQVNASNVIEDPDEILKSSSGNLKKIEDYQSPEHQALDQLQQVLLSLPPENVYDPNCIPVLWSVIKAIENLPMASWTQRHFKSAPSTYKEYQKLQFEAAYPEYDKVEPFKNMPNEPLKFPTFKSVFNARQQNVNILDLCHQYCIKRVEKYIYQIPRDVRKDCITDPRFADFVKTETIAELRDSDNYVTKAAFLDYKREGFSLGYFDWPQMEVAKWGHTNLAIAEFDSEQKTWLIDGEKLSFKDKLALVGVDTTLAYIGYLHDDVEKNNFLVIPINQKNMSFSLAGQPNEVIENCLLAFLHQVADKRPPKEIADFEVFMKAVMPQRIAGTVTEVLQRLYPNNVMCLADSGRRFIMKLNESGNDLQLNVFYPLPYIMSNSVQLPFGIDSSENNKHQLFEATEVDDLDSLENMLSVCAVIDLKLVNGVVHQEGKSFIINSHTADFSANPNEPHPPLTQELLDEMHRPKNNLSEMIESLTHDSLIDSFFMIDDDSPKGPKK